MGTLRTYIIGLGLSIVATLVAFGLVQQHLQTDHVFPSHEMATPLLVGFALLQLLVQLVCFLHLGEERKPRWNLTVFAFALIVVGILVGGTLWIMQNLSHGQMQEPPDIFTEENIFPHTE